MRGKVSVSVRRKLIMYVLLLFCCTIVYVDIPVQRYEMLHIQGVPGGMDKTSGECSLC